MLYYLLVTIYVLACLLLLLVVLLQQGRGGDIASAFGGGGSTQTAFGARQGATVLTRASTVLGILFMVGALALSVMGQRGPGSVVSGVKGTLPTPRPAQSAPARPAGQPSGSTAPAPQAPAQTTPAQTPAAPGQSQSK